MTITVSVTAPNNKRALVSRSDDTEQYVEPGQTGSFVVYDDLSLSISEVEPVAPEAQAQGGGNGNPPPGI